jgi:putative addiction module component (TIGR02574 family)
MDPATTMVAVRQWSLEDQIEFVFNLWDQLVDDGWQPEPTPELLAELDRRVALHEANPENVRTWEQVVQHVRRPR